MRNAIVSLSILFVTLLSLTWFRLEQFRLGYDVAQSMGSFKRSEDAYKLKLITYTKRTGLTQLNAVAQNDAGLVESSNNQIIQLRSSN